MYATDVADFAGFDAAFQSMKTTGGGTINLTASITVPIAVSTTYSLSSDVANPITITTNAFTIIASSLGTGTTDQNQSVLEVGANVTIQGTQTVLQATAKSIVRVVGGVVQSTTTALSTGNPSVIYSDGSGNITISGGTISMDATTSGAANNFAIYINNFMILTITGGTIQGTGTGGRTIRVGTSSTATISGATISAAGTSYAILSNNSSIVTIGNNTTVNADATSTALFCDGAASRLIIPGNATGVTINATVKYAATNGAATLDMRNVTLTASPISGTALTDPTNIVLTASGNESMALAGIYYNYDTAPTISSTNINSGGNVYAYAATNTIKACIGRAGYIDATVYTFTYTVQNPEVITLIGTLQNLKDAYTASKTASGTSKWKLSTDITITDVSFVLKPDATHPVILDANAKLLIINPGQNASDITIGGNLTVTSTPTANGLIKIYGSNNDAKLTNIKIEGGNYTVNGNYPIIFANSGSNVNNVSTKLYLSDATFTVNGTTNGASIVKYATSNGNLLSASNCIFNISAAGVAFSMVGPANILISNSTLNMAGSDANSIAISYAPTNAASNTLTISGLTTNMTAGKIMVLGGTKALNVVVKDLTVSSATPTLYTYTAGVGGTLKFYDFRALTADITPGTYTTTQNVTLSMGSTAVDAAGASIYYTIDGTEPTAASTLYTSPVSVATSKTIKAIAIKDTFTGNSKSFAYIINGTDVANPDKNALSVYPTDVEDILNISTLANRVQVYDITGKSVLSRNNVKQLDLSSIHSGVYFVKVKLSDATSKTFKIVKQ
jgi:hypothetical protein